MRIVSALLLTALLTMSAEAQSLVDDFTGLTVGANLAGQSGWTKGGTGPDLTVGNTTSLTYTGYLNGGAEYAVIPTPTSTASRVYKTFAQPVTNYAGKTFYFSFLLRLTSTSTTATGYFMSLGNAGTGTSYAAKLFAKTNGTGLFNIGLSKTSNTAVFGSTALSLNTTYLIVVRYTFNDTGTVAPAKTDDDTYLWVNPSLSSEPSVSAAECTDTSSTETDFDGYGTLAGGVGNFIWHNRGTANPAGAFDGVRVGNGLGSSAAWANLMGAPHAAISPANIGFGNLNVSSHKTDTITVKSDGVGSLNITSVTSSKTPFVVAPTSGTVSSGDSLKFAVTYTPTAVASDTGSIAFVSNSISSPDTVTVTGAGIQAGFSMSPASINFGTIFSDSTKVDTVTVSNASTSAHLVVDSVKSSNPFYTVSPLTADISISSQAKFAVTFHPTSKGVAPADIIFYHNAPSLHDTLKVNANVVLKEPIFSALSDSINFHGVLVGKSKTDTITVKNTGFDSLLVSGVASTNGSFVVTPTTARLDTMASKKFVVTFTPGTAGSKQGLVVFTSNVSETKDTVWVMGSGATVVSIAEARKDDDHDFIADHSVTKDTLFLSGVITSPNVQTSPQSGYFMQDTSAGIIIFSYDPAPVTVAIGDSVLVIGTVTQYRGLVELSTLKMDTTNFKVLKHNAVVPKPKIISVHDFVTSAESYEGSLIEIDTLHYSSGMWPADGSNGSIYYKAKTGTDSVQIFVDKDTEVDGTAQPLDPVNFKGIVSQYTSASTVYNDGYELIPRDTNDIKHLVIDAVSGQTNATPTAFALYQNYPNPFNPSTVIRYDLPKNAYVKVMIYDILGRVVANLVDGVQTASQHSVQWNPNGLSSGIYFCRIQAHSQDGTSNFASVKKLLYMK
jgi:hypothetical protein